MPREYRLYLNDIIEAARFIERQTQGVTYGEFTADEIRLQALLHNLMIIGEAVKHIPAEVRERAPGVPWAEVAGMRDVIVHGYFELDLPLLWHVVREEVTQLRQQIEALLKELDESQAG
jgi:uncharacterized protein with HEPN domain